MSITRLNQTPCTGENRVYRKEARIAEIPLSLDRLDILNLNTEGDTYSFPYIFYAVTNQQRDIHADA
jgi:hypothetical protein